MSRYDGLIIPRSYSEYINKTDAATLQQALQLPGVMDNAPTVQSTKPAKSGGIFAANAVIMASSTTLSGVAISAGSVVRVLFTADLTGSDATTGLTLTYNGDAYAVKVGKNGALAAFVASEISTGVFKYLQVYTTLELIFDGTQFIINGNPVVLSSPDYTIYADGSTKYNRNTFSKVITIAEGEIAANVITGSFTAEAEGLIILAGTITNDVYSGLYIGSNGIIVSNYSYDNSASSNSQIIVQSYHFGKGESITYWLNQMNKYSIKVYYNQPI